MAEGVTAGSAARHGGLLVGRTLALFALVVALMGGAFAADAFPPLTGRVVDEAGLLSTAARAALDTKLKALEDKSGIQLVVATVRTLGGDEVEPYANRLFRAWKLGDAKKNNGVLLLVAAKEHKTRIEVGYGLEGTLTDALTKTIITNALAPRFKAGDFAGGIDQGVDDIIAVLSTDSAEWQKRPHLRPDTGGSGLVLLPFVLVFGFVVLVLYLQRNARSGTGRRGGGIVILPTGSSSFDTRSELSGSDSSGDSGFSGGGGSSGGGGASGDW